MNPLSFLTTVAVSAETDPNAQFTLKNAGGMEVRLAADGARITALKVPDRAGLLADVVLGHDAVDSYRTSEKKPYLGATLGRYAGRIAHGSFTLDGVTHKLAKNNGPNHNHGGLIGFDKVVWKATPGPDRVRFDYRSPASEEGYPGNLDVSVTYTLTEENALIIDYQATTDRATPAPAFSRSALPADTRRGPPASAIPCYRIPPPPPIRILTA